MFKEFIEFLGYARYMLNKQWKNNEHEMELSMEGISVKEPKTCKTPSPLTMKYDFEFSHFVIWVGLQQCYLLCFFMKVKSHAIMCVGKHT